MKIREKDIELLANSPRVMNWRQCNGGRKWKVRLDVYKWNPFEKLSSALMVADKIGLLNLRQTPAKDWIAYLGGCKHSNYAESPAEAIGVAALFYLRMPKEKT